MSGYDNLSRILSEALEQASEGKGKERHAGDRAFDDQSIIRIGQLVGMGYQTGQTIKKATEAQGMASRGQHGAAKAELLGAINYLAAAAMNVEQAALAGEMT